MVYRYTAHKGNLFARFTACAAALGFALVLAGCGYNEFQRLDEQSKAAWSEVLNQYQRRADLVPNIVATVKGSRFRAGHPYQSGRGSRKGNQHAGDSRDFG